MGGRHWALLYYVEQSFVNPEGSLSRVESGGVRTSCAAVCHTAELEMIDQFSIVLKLQLAPTKAPTCRHAFL